MQRHTIQPQDVLIVVGELGMVVVVRFDGVRLQMSMSGRTGMVGVSLMHVLRRHRCERDVRRQDQADNDAAEGRRHVR